MKKCILASLFFVGANFLVASNLQLNIDSIIVNNQKHRLIEPKVNILLPKHDTSFYLDYNEGKLLVNIKYYKVQMATSIEHEYHLLFGKSYNAVDFWIDAQNRNRIMQAYTSKNNGKYKLGVFGYYNAAIESSKEEEGVFIPFSYRFKWNKVVYVNSDNKRQIVDFESARISAKSFKQYDLPSFSKQQYSVQEEPCYVNGKAGLRIFLVDKNNSQISQILVRNADYKGSLPRKIFVAFVGDGLVQVLGFKFQIKKAAKL